MSASRNSILCSIVFSLLCSGTGASAEAGPTRIGREIAAIRGAAYDAFANKDETESGAKASCISMVVFGLRRLGLDCGYRDFKVYYKALVKQASVLEPGKTRTSARGLVFFTRAHFAALYSDRDGNGVVDREDEIIHAYFSPVQVTTLAAWLERDPGRPVYYIDLEQAFSCPGSR